MGSVEPIQFVDVDYQTQSLQTDRLSWMGKFALYMPILSCPEKLETQRLFDICIKVQMLQQRFSKKSRQTINYWFAMPVKTELKTLLG